MTKPRLHITSNAEAELPDEWIDYIMEQLKPRINAIIDERLADIIVPVEPYMPIDWFISKWKFSRQTFTNIIGTAKKRKVHSIKKPVGIGLMYNVEQFKKALQAYTAVKPEFKNSFIKRVG